MYKKINISVAFMKKFCKKFLVNYVSFYLIFSPIIATTVNAQSLPINPVPNNATMGTPSNNIPVLNIAKPSDAGVSVNKFKDFNVGQEGLIVNNLNLQDYNFNYKSELSGGHVEFNPNFRDGDYAKVILNEVVSNSKTAMNGFTEIYGHPADYIVANPNGITCAGCGFINTTRLALITGSSNIKNGEIESFTISPNAVLRIDGQGVGNLGLYSPSSADLVSNAIKISGDVAVYGDLKVLSGNDKYDWNLQTISSKGETSPELAVDVYSLGGMKAGNITVIATQKGFGVNLDGDVVADAGNIEITSEGEIKLKNIVAQNDIIANSKGNLSTIDNGKIIANDFVLLNSGKDISLFGDKILSNEIVLMAENDFTNNSIINSDNDLYIEAKGNFENKSQISAVNDFELLSGKNIKNSNGLLISGNDLFISSNQSIENNANIVSKNYLIMQSADNFSLGKNSLLKSDNDLYIEAGGNLDNSGEISSNKNLVISAKNLSNYNQIKSNEDMELEVKENFSNYENSSLSSEGNMYISAYGNFLNKSNIISNDDIELYVKQNFDSQKGAVNSKNNMYIVVGGNFVNSSDIVSDNNLFIGVNGDFTNYLNVASKKDFELQVLGNLYNKQNAYLLAYNDFNVITNKNLENIGKINSGNNLFVSALDLDNYGQLLANNDMDLYIGNNLINYRGSGILSGKDMHLYIANNLVNYKADIYAGGDLVVEGRDDLSIDYQALDTNKTYDNPYIEAEPDPNITVVDVPFTYTDPPDDEDLDLTIILENGENLEIPPDIIGDDMQPGDEFQYAGYTFIIGEESITEIDVPNPEYQNCIDEDACAGISPTIKQKVYSYSGDDKFTIKDSSGKNISYTESIPAGDPNDEQVVSDNTNVINNNILDEFKNVAVNYPFTNNFLNNFVNYAGKIEAKGNIEISAKSITNKGFDYNTGDKAVTKKYNKIRNEACSWTCGWRILGQDELVSVNLNSLPASIVSGGNLVLNALGDILNQNSILSSKGDMILKAQSLTNLTTSEIVSFTVNYQRIKIKRKKWKIGKHHENKTEVTKKRIYNKQRATILSGGNLSIKAGNIQNDQDVNPNGDIVVTLTNKPIENGHISIDIQLPVGNNGLFKVSKNEKYLIENNVPFINVEDYIGSGYFFKGLGNFWDGVDTNKIIGDPAYETKLVMDAIVKATQQHYLVNDGSIGSDAEQMKALYDNATDVYEELGLKVGVALTEDQIAALHKDIIWYVEREVNGEKVLVPELYLSQATLDAIDSNDGSKISGFNVGIESDFVSNYGNISSDNILSVKSNTLLNESNDDQIATMKSKGLTTIESSNVLNLSGNIEGKITQIKSDNIINQTKVLSDDYDDKYELKKHTEIASNTASISGENGVSLEVNNALINSGANIESKEGDVNIKAGTAIFDTVQLHNRSEKKTTNDNIVSSSTKTEIKDTIENKSSNINAGGNLILSTDGDATFAGANVSAGGDALLDIGGQTNILDVKDTEFNYSKTTKSYAGGLYSKKDTVIDESEKAKGTSVDVTNGLNIISGGDVNIVASDINVGGDANILAGYSLTDEGVKKTDASSSVNILNDLETTRHYEKHEKSNFVNAVLTLAGGFVVPYNFEFMGVHGFKDFIANGGKIEVKEKIGEKTSDMEETITKDVVSSNLNISGNLNIGSTDNINIAGSNLITKGNTSLDADNDINIMSAINKINSESEHKDTSISLTRSAGNSYVDTAFAVYAVEEARRQLLEAGDALEEIRKKRDEGLATDEAVKDAEINRDIAKVNLAMKIYEAEEAVRKSITSTPSFGFYANVGITEEGSVSKTKTEDTINTSSQILSGGDVIFNADKDMTQKGSDVYSANGDIIYNVGNNLNLSASVDTHSSSSSTENFSSSQTMGTNGPGFSVGYGRSSSTEYSETYNNSTSTAENGDIIYKVGGDMNAIGYNAIAKNILAIIGGDLTFASLQNKEYNVSSSSSADLSISFSMGDNNSETNNNSNEQNNGESKSDSKNESKSENKAENNKTETKSDSKDDSKKDKHVSGGSGSVKNSNSTTDNKSSNISGLIGTESVNIDVGGKLSMTGSVIANMSNGVDLGNLNVKASSLNYEDIEDKQYQKETGFGLGLTLGENKKDNDSNGTTVGKNTGIKTNNSGDSIYVAMTDKGFEGNDYIHSTIGKGNLDIADGSGEGINRDTDNIVEEGEKKITGALDFEVTIDLDLFYDIYDGMEEIWKEVKDGLSKEDIKFLEEENSIIRDPNASQEEKKEAEQNIVNKLLLRYAEKLNYDENGNIKMDEKSKEFMLYVIAYTEGGVSNRENDKGGYTKYGITKDTYNSMKEKYDSGDPSYSWFEKINQDFDELNTSDAKIIIEEEFFKRTGYNYINNFDVAFHLTDARVNQGDNACKSGCVARLVNDILGTNFTRNDTFSENSAITQAVNNMTQEQTEMFVQQIIDKRIEGYIKASGTDIQKSDFFGWMGRLFRGTKTETEFNNMYSYIEKSLNKNFEGNMSKEELTSIFDRLNNQKNVIYNEMFNNRRIK